MPLLRSTRVLALGLFLTAPPCFAQVAGGQQNQAAVDLAYEGKERFEAADYATALDRFEKARALAASPVFDLYIARSLKALGRWREALIAYERTAQYQVEASNVSFLQAQENAARERTELEARMPRLSITAPHLSDDAAVKLEIDGEPTPVPTQGLAFDPGKHVLSASAGAESHGEVVTLAAGQSLEIELPFGKQAADTATPAAQSEPSTMRGLSPLAWTAFGIGAAGLVVGVTTGTWALVNMSELNAHCEETNACSGGMPSNPDYLELRNTTSALATTADIGFIVAGAGALLGVTFALTLGKDKKKDAPSALELRPLGAGWALAGTF